MKLTSLFFMCCGKSDAETEIPLPDELLSEIIFKYVPLCRWSRCLELVSKQFQRCAFIAYKRVKSIEIRNLFPLKLKNELFEEKVKRKSQRSIDRLNEILEKLLSACPFLTELKGFDAITLRLDDSHCDILKKFNRLRSISLENLKISQKCAASLGANCKSLKIFHLLYISSLYDGPIERLDLATTNMTDIALVSDGRFYPHEIFYFGSCFESLTTLKLISIKVLFQINETDEQMMTKCPNLQSLTALVRDTDDIQILLKALPNLHKLTSLNLNFRNQKIVPYVDDLRAALKSLANRLESLVLYNASFEELQHFLFTKCLHLRQLEYDLHLSPSINELPRLSATLERFSVRSNELYWPANTPSMIVPNLLGLANLIHLDLTFFRTRLAETCRDLYRLEKLRHLQLPIYGPECTVGDPLLQTWGSNGMFVERLVTLEMPWCSLVTDVGARLLAEKAKNLENLQLCKSRITDKTILSFADGAKKLKKVIFLQDHPRLITGGAIAQLVKKCGCLKIVHVNQLVAKELAENKEFLPFVDEVKILGF